MANQTLGHSAVGAAPARDMARIARVVAAIFIVAPLPWVIANFYPPINHDVAALLHFADRWMGGERLYVDLIDINPPLIFLLNLIPVAIAKATPLGGPNALVISVLAFMAGAMALSWALIRRWTLTEGHPFRYLLVPLFLFLMLVYPGTDFAQRENLLTTATLPYLLLAHLRVSGQRLPLWLRLAVALFAAVAFAIKPHFLIVPLIIEGYVLWARGARAAFADPVPWTMAAVFAGYAAYVMLVTPAYLSFIVPLAEEYYSHLGLGPWGVVYGSQLTITIGLFVILVPIAVLVTRSRLAHIATLGTLAAILVAIAQGKGWSYHVLPAECLVLLLAAVILGDVVSRVTPPGSAGRWTAVITLVAGFMTGAYYVSNLTRSSIWSQAFFSESDGGRLYAFVKRYAPGQPVLVLSTGIQPYFPVLNHAGSSMAMRFMSLWLLQPAFETCPSGGRRYRDPAEMGEGEAYVFKALGEDIVKWHPKMAIVDTVSGIPLCGGRDIDFVEYFSRNPQFAAEWRHFRLADTSGRFRIYVRAD